MSVRPLVHRSIGPSVRPRIGDAFAFRPSRSDLGPCIRPCFIFVYPLIIFFSLPPSFFFFFLFVFPIRFLREFFYQSPLTFFHFSLRDSSQICRRRSPVCRLRTLMRRRTFETWMDRCRPTVDFLPTHCRLAADLLPTHCQPVAD